MHKDKNSHLVKINNFQLLRIHYCYLGNNCDSLIRIYKELKMRRYYTERQDTDGDMYTDLAIERRRVDLNTPGVEYKSVESEGGIWECIRIYSEEGAKNIGRPMGIYDTLNTGRMDLLTEDEMYDAQNEVAKKLCEIFDRNSVIPDRILICGLGNEKLTPDSVGPKAAHEVKPTLHIKHFDEEMFDALECSEIAVVTPGVTAQSGLDASVMIKSVTERIEPDAVILIDAIATASGERLGSTIQISDTGIFPGGGVGNSRCALNGQTLGTPTVAIGLPTVIDSRIFCNNKEQTKMSGEAMLVSPKEIDEICDIGAKIIGGAINQAFGISPF